MAAAADSKEDQVWQSLQVPLVYGLPVTRDAALS